MTLRCRVLNDQLEVIGSADLPDGHHGNALAFPGPHGGHVAVAVTPYWIDDSGNPIEPANHEAKHSTRVEFFLMAGDDLASSLPGWVAKRPFRIIDIGVSF